MHCHVLGGSMRACALGGSQFPFQIIEEIIERMAFIDQFQIIKGLIERMAFIEW